MKKILFFAILACVFVSCSSDGSREIQIDEVEFVRGVNVFNVPIEKYSKVSSIFEVVPGKYSISWKLVNDVPQLKNFSIELKLKLRLKKTVKVLPTVFENLTNASSKDNNGVYMPFGFYLLDANGERDENSSAVQRFEMDRFPNDVIQTKGYYDIDKMMDFFKFLASKPGTEIDIVCYAIGSTFGAQDCVKTIKNAKGIQCEMDDDDDSFSYKFGTIVE